MPDAINTIDRFWQYVWIPQKSDGNVDYDRCWIWTRSKDRSGYGWFRVGKHVWRASRYAYSISHIYQTLIPGWFACHSCDTPSCCNPLHLQLGSPSENTQAMYLRGRHPGRKMQIQDVLLLLEDHKNGASIKELAVKYGIGEWQCAAIIRGDTWFYLGQHLMPGRPRKRKKK